METRAVVTGAVAGTLAGVLGSAAFLAFHAVVIVPIWTSAGSGLLGGAVSGAIMGAGLSLVFRGTRAGDGLRAGAMLWGGLLLVAVLLQFVRRTVGRPPEAAEVLSAIGVVALYGAVVAYRIHRTRWSALGGAVASVVVLLMSAGPLTTTTPRGIAIFASLLPVLALFGVTWAWLRHLVVDCLIPRWRRGAWTRPSGSVPPAWRGRAHRPPAG